MRTGHRTATMMKSAFAGLVIAESSFLIAANGEMDAPPSSGLREYLVPRAAEVTAIFHPLNPEDAPIHRIVKWRRGEIVLERSVRLFSRPPLTYGFDALIPIRRPRVDAWFGFNNLAAVHGVARRGLGLVGQVVYWAVDFVPDRFGPETC